MKGRITSLLAASLLSGPAGAAHVTHYVSLEGLDESPYLTPETGSRTVQAAIDVCAEGDSIVILPGDYHEDIVMNKQGLKIAGAGPGATCIWGSLRAGIDAGISGVEFRQECAENDPDFSTFGILTARTGVLTIAQCVVSGTFKIGVNSTGMVMGLVLLSETEILGDGTNVGISMSSWSGQPVFLIDRCKVAKCRVGLDTNYAPVWVTRSSFVGNEYGLNPFGSLTVQASSIDRNGRGIWLHGWAPAWVESSTVCRNREGVVADEGAYVQLKCCTISDNDTGVWLTGECCAEVYPTKCIVWGNKSANVVIEGVSTWFDPGYSDIPGYEELRGRSNINADPLFVDREAGNYRLRPGSPCIDPTPWGGDFGLGANFDRDGKQRFAYGGGDYGVVLDIGAYEYHINEVSPGPEEGEVALTWSYHAGSSYTVLYSEDLLTWRVAERLPEQVKNLGTWVDDGSLTGIPPSLARNRFYRLLENP